jgi:hypothetical protein
MERHPSPPQDVLALLYAESVPAGALACYDADPGFHPVVVDADRGRLSAMDHRHFPEGPRRYEFVVPMHPLVGIGAQALLVGEAVYRASLKKPALRARKEGSYATAYSFAEGWRGGLHAILVAPGQPVEELALGSVTPRAWTVESPSLPEGEFVVLGAPELIGRRPYSSDSSKFGVAVHSLDNVLRFIMEDHVPDVERRERAERRLIDEYAVEDVLDS